MSKGTYYSIECRGHDPSQITSLIRFAENILGVEVIEATAVVNSKVVKLTDYKEEAE